MQRRHIDANVNIAEPPHGLETFWSVTKKNISKRIVHKFLPFCWSTLDFDLKGPKYAQKEKLKLGKT